MNRPEVSLHDQITALLPRLRRFARTIARHSADADDLVQLTVERALVRLDQWRADTRLESWMFTIMKNAWIDEVRARVRTCPRSLHTCGCARWKPGSDYHRFGQ